MIDCSKTENYFNEKLKMTKKHKLNGGAYICELNCTDCPLSNLNNGTTDNMSCSDFEVLYPKEAVKAVQQWSDENQPKTYLTELLDKYPNVLLNDDGTPEGICPHQLGLKSSIVDCKNGYDCPKCWNQQIEDGEE